MNCSPLVELDNKNNKKNNNNTLRKLKTIKPINSSSCLSLSVIKQLVQAWNNKNPDDKINTNQPAQGLYRELKSKFDGKDEIMWFEHDIIDSLLDKSKIDELKQLYFKPLAPETWSSNPKQWLSNNDIEKVLNQYEIKYPEFKSYGALPIDFDLKSGNSCVINNICSISLESLMNQNKKYIGVIFNLDKHNESGSHWIALFVNIPKGELNFWDSVAKPAPPEVEKLMNKLEKQLKIIKEKQTLYKKCNCCYKDIVKQYNKIQHQFENTECGMYSLHFIIEQLDEGKDFNQVCRNIINDSKMNAMRKEYFTLKKDNTENKSIFNFFK